MKTQKPRMKHRVGTKKLQLIANAVAHRSYLEPGNIQVALFDDRLEITSPGMLLNNVIVCEEQWEK